MPLSVNGEVERSVLACVTALYLSVKLNRDIEHASWYLLILLGMKVRRKIKVAFIRLRKSKRNRGVVLFSLFQVEEPLYRKEYLVLGQYQVRSEVVNTAARNWCCILVVHAGTYGNTSYSMLIIESSVSPCLAQWKRESQKRRFGQNMKGFSRLKEAPRQFLRFLKYVFTSREPLGN